MKSCPWISWAVQGTQQDSPRVLLSPPHLPFKEGRSEDYRALGLMGRIPEGTVVWPKIGHLTKWLKVCHMLMLGRGGPWANLVRVNCNWFSKKLLVLLPFLSCVTLSHTQLPLSQPEPTETHVKEDLFEAKCFIIQIAAFTHTLSTHSHDQAGTRIHLKLCVCMYMFI